jgi:ATP-binding cassette, subfamily B, bacterial PglK
LTSLLAKWLGRERASTTFSELARNTATSWGLLTRKEQVSYGATFLLGLLMNGLDLISVGLTGLLGAMTATGLSGGGSYYILGIQIPFPSPENVIAIVGGIAILIIVKGALQIWVTRYSQIVLAGIEIRNSVKIARYFFSGSLGRLRQFSRAEISFVINNSTNATFSGVLGAVNSIVVEIALFVAIFVVFIIVDPIGAMGVVVYILLIVYLMQLFTARRYLQSGRNIRAASVDAGTSILEMVDAFREISVLSKQDYFLTRFGEAVKLSVRTGLTLQILKKVPRYIAESGLVVGIFFFVIWQLSRGSLAEGLIAVGIFMAGSFRMMGAILPLQATWNELRVQQHWVSQAQEILLTLKDQPELLDPRPYSVTRAKVEKMIGAQIAGGISVQMRDVSFTHAGSDEETIRNVSLSIPAGKFAAFVGPSGAGKTTLVDLLLGLHDADSGVVALAGMDPRELREKHVGLISYVPQKPGLVSGSFASNIALGVDPEDVDEDLVRESLRKAQLLDFVESLAEGIHSTLGTQADSLSGGQAQRLGLARALYTQPKFVILDEATSALDASTEASIAESIRNIGDDTTVLVVAHRLSTIQHADVVFVIDGGKVLAQGTFREVRKKVPMIEEYVRLMSFDQD